MHFNPFPKEIRAHVQKLEVHAGLFHSPTTPGDLETSAYHSIAVTNHIKKRLTPELCLHCSASSCAKKLLQWACVWHSIERVLPASQLGMLCSNRLHPEVPSPFCAGIPEMEKENTTHHKPLPITTYKCKPWHPQGHTYCAGR